MIRWPSPPDPRPPLEDCTHVWSVELDDASFDARLWRVRVSPQEQARADRFKFERDQRRYVIAHAALRDILAGYLNAAPADLQFIEGPNGKPKLALAFAACRIEFNLSHSHERALLAVSQGREVGVDVEFVGRDFQFDEVAERFFTRSEVSELRDLPTHLQRQAFFKCWTSKEAFLKAKGTGLSGKLDEVAITLSADQRVQINASVPNWSLTELDPGDDYEGALVIEGEPAPVRCYRWEARLSV